MLEEPKIKKVDKRDKQLPQNFEQLIEMYDIEKIWPFILKTIQFINKEIPEDFKELIEKYELEDILKFFKSASKIMYFNASGKGMAIGKVSEKDAFEVNLPMWTKGEIYNSGNIKSLPSGTDGRDYWNNLDNGWYWYGNTNAVSNMPSNWGFVEKRGFIGNSDFTVLFYTQSNGPIFRKSGNANDVSNWIKITGDASGKGVKTLSSKSDGGWSNQTDGDAYLITKAFMAYWNGAYSGTSSNLTYCSGGEIMPKGDISCSIWDKGGWTKIAGKLLVQWGEGNGISISANSVTDKTITFHQSFTKTPLVFIQPCGNYDIVGQVNNISKTNFLARIRNRNSSAVSDRWFNWFAIGI